MLISSDIFVQIVGGIGAILSIYVFQKKNRTNMLGVQALGSLFLAGHFLLLGGFTAAAMSSINVIRSIVFLDNKKRNIGVLFLFLLLYVLFGILTWQGPVSFLPVLGMVVITVAFWQTDTSKIRYLALFSPPLWIIYNVLFSSYPGIVLESFVFFSIVLARVRFD